jgi:hypothetical protein
MVKQLSSMLMRFPCERISIVRELEILDTRNTYSGVASLTADGNIGTTELLDWYANCHGVLANSVPNLGGKSEGLTNRHAQAVQAKKAVTAVAAGELLAVAALSSVLLAVDVCFGGVRGGRGGGGCGGREDGGGEDDELGEGCHCDRVDRWSGWGVGGGVWWIVMLKLLCMCDVLRI